MSRVSRMPRRNSQPASVGSFGLKDAYDRRVRRFGVARSRVGFVPFSE